MEPIQLQYQGLPLVLIPVAGEDESRVYGYGLTCPHCKHEFFINTGVGPKPDHHIAVGATRQVTILPAIRCPFHCGWCIRVIDGIAYECRRQADR